MIFNLVNMINEIRTIEEIDFTDKYFFDCFFGTLSIKMNVKKNGNTLNFDPPRVSEVMTGKDNLYEVIAKLPTNLRLRVFYWKILTKCQEFYLEM